MGSPRTLDKPLQLNIEPLTQRKEAGATRATEPQNFAHDLYPYQNFEVPHQSKNDLILLDYPYNCPDV